jgi:hypothetical protein
VSLNLSVLIGIMAILGFLWCLRRPKQNAFLLVWFLAPIAWLFQDYTRFVAQVSLAGAALGGIFLDDVISRLKSSASQRAASVSFVVLATLLPLGIPSLAAEATWALGIRYPRALDWEEVEQLAQATQQAERRPPLVNVYFSSLASALATYAPLQVVKGHWVEVQPSRDPADALSVTDMIHVVPLPADDTVLADIMSRGWIRVLGGTATTSVVAFERQAPAPEVEGWIREIISANAHWLADHAINNTMAPPEVMLDASRLATHRLERQEQRRRAGRIQLAMLVYALSSESTAPDRASQLRGVARGWGSLAAFLGDESSLDFVSQDRHETLRSNLAGWAREAQGLDGTAESTSRFDSATATLFAAYFWAA